MKHSFLLLACICLWVLPLHCAKKKITQAVVVDTTSMHSRLVSFARNAAQFSYNYAQEKAYLHFDNTGYFLGESIWFKAYVVNALNLMPSSMSKTLYVELLTQEGSIVTSKKIKLSNGVGSGDFYMPDSLPGGFYEVRAYTRCMLNFGNEVVFSRVFPVYSQPIPEGKFENRIMEPRENRIENVRENRPYKDKINLSFYPEGGTLVKGIPTTVAFKATDKNGFNLNLTGTVFDTQNQRVLTFKTEHDGMGAFFFTPTSTNYTVRVQVNNNEESFKLPVIETSGYVLNVATLAAQPTGKVASKKSDSTPDSLLLIVNKSADLTSMDSMALVLTCRGKLLDFRFVQVPKEGLNTYFAKDKLPAGINQFTLYDVQGRIQCERLVCIAPNLTAEPVKTKNSKTKKAKTATAELFLKTDKKSYKPYEKIKLEIFSTDTASTNQGTSISVAVRDLQTSDFGNADRTDIVTNLLLASDLKGYINNPGWYFKDNAKETQRGLDLLMLTQGWRRYNWKQMEGMEPFKVIHPIEEGLILDGEVRSVLFKKVRTDVDLLFWMTRGLSSYQGRTLTDTLGRFQFALNDVWDDWELNLRTTLESKVKDYRISLNRQFSPAPRFLTIYDKIVQTGRSLNLPYTQADSIMGILGVNNYPKMVELTNKGYKEYMLKEFVKTSNNINSFNELISRKAAVQIDVDNETDAYRDKFETETTSIITFLENYSRYFSGLTYKGKGILFQVVVHGKTIRYSPLDLRDTFQNLSEGWEISDVTVQDIERISVVEFSNQLHYFGYTFYQGGGEKVIVYVFLKENLIREPLGIRKTRFKGYSAPKEFYTPFYPEGEPVIDPDYRRTLYWNSEVILDKKGKANVEFYNNGSCKTMEFSAEGITGNGVLLKNNP